MTSSTQVQRLIDSCMDIVLDFDRPGGSDLMGIAYLALHRVAELHTGLSNPAKFRSLAKARMKGAILDWSYLENGFRRTRGKDGRCSYHRPMLSFTDAKIPLEFLYRNPEGHRKRLAGGDDGDG